MDTEKAIIIIGVTLAIVLVINAGILATYLRSRSSGRLKVFGRAIQSVRDPFRSENENLNELRNRVSKLENQSLEEFKNDR